MDCKEKDLEKLIDEIITIREKQYQFMMEEQSRIEGEFKAYERSLQAQAESYWSEEQIIEHHYEKLSRCIDDDDETSDEAPKSYLTDCSKTIIRQLFENGVSSKDIIETYTTLEDYYYQFGDTQYNVPKESYEEVFSWIQKNESSKKVCVGSAFLEDNDLPFN